MIDTNAVFQEINIGIAQIVKQAAGQYAVQAEQDVKAFSDGAKVYIVEWVQQLNEGKMSKDEFEFLAAGRLKDLPQMHTLTQVGIAAATLDATRTKIVNFAIKTISARIG
ncbi:MAG: hypothetical protein KKH28_05640 [Elusimicrobia bacterium]|nr:hypothetical protein [Elusimicrobiota bacterium]